MKFKTKYMFTLVSAMAIAFVATQMVFLWFLPEKTQLVQPCNYLNNVVEFMNALVQPEILSRKQNHHHHHLEKGIDCDEVIPFLPLEKLGNNSNVLIVDQIGCGNYTTVQAAVNAVPDNTPNRTIIFMTPGVYIEKVSVPRTKPNITFQGHGFLPTFIVWNDTANSSGGTFYSASVSIFADNFVAKDINFVNSAPAANPGDMGGQAVALRISGDKAAFYSCGFYGAQDTLHDDRGRHYFQDCFIQGSIDFIFGNARSLYQECVLNSIANPVPSGSTMITGAIAAQARGSCQENTGFSFVKCLIQGTGNLWLGRAWRPYSRIIFSYTYMPAIISPDGWNDWNDPNRDWTVFYAQYRCTGPGANQTMRVWYARELTQYEACPFLDISYIDGDQWLFPSVPAYYLQFRSHRINQFSSSHAQFNSG